MKHFFLLLFIVQALCTTDGSAATVTSGQVYPLAYMNITSDRAEEGFVQLYGFSINDTKIRVEALPGSINKFATIGTIVNNRFNMTIDFDADVFITDYVSTINYEKDQLGVVTASSDLAYFVGVKSDRGSTDAFLALPLVKTSKEFFVAGWQFFPPFYASCVVIPAVAGTCVEIYQVRSDGTWSLLAEEGLNQFETFRYYVDLELDQYGNQIPNTLGDMTGYYINATKPIQVLCGHECARVPQDVPFCDHMVEQIPPVQQLGTFFVVPPIYGRNPSAGFVVRVVAAYQNTLISVTGGVINGTTASSVTKQAGGWAEINTTSSTTPIVVTCSQPCLVMQYNKGRKAATNDIPTDPFMMLVVPADRFTSGAGFATPNYCDLAKLRINFDNWVTIVTFTAYKDNLMIDNTPLSQYCINNVQYACVSSNSIPGFYIISFRISHDFHSISNAPGTFGSFAVYVYGHSILGTSSSGYGFSANYNITGDPVSEVWEQSVDDFNQYLKNLRLNGTCANESTLVDPILSDVMHVSFPLTLSASFDPVAMSDDCLNGFYNKTLWNKLVQMSHLINQWICSQANCSYLNGNGVAVNYNTLSVNFIKNAQGAYIGMTITVEMVASLDTSSINFGTCRAEIRNFMTQFVNWPSSNANFFQTSGPANCPWPLKFSQPAFVVAEPQCTTA